MSGDVISLTKWQRNLVGERNEYSSNARERHFWLDTRYNIISSILIRILNVDEMILRAVNMYRFV